MPPELREATFYKKLKNGLVQCTACNRYCTITPGKVGNCCVRKNIGGKLYSLVFGKTLTMAVDPVEKKPLFHFKPGSRCMSVSTYGCNFHCLQCFSAETMVLTDNGIETIGGLFDSAEPFDEEENLSIKRFSNTKAVTHLGNVFDLMYGFRHSYEGDLLEIKPFYLPGFRCTPNHKIFVEMASGEKLTKTADELVKGDFLIIPKSNSFRKTGIIDLGEFFKNQDLLFKKSVSKYDLNKVEKIFSLYLSGWTSKMLGKKFDMHPTYVRHLISKIKKHGFSYLFEHKGGIIVDGDKVKFKLSKNEVARFIRVNADFAKLLGYYCAEGSVGCHKNRPNSYYLRFSFGKHEEKYAAEVKRLIVSVFGVNSAIDQVETALNVVVGNSIVSLFFKMIAGTGAGNKVVPKEILFSDNSIKKAFLAAYIAGDGWVGKKIISMNTVSRNLAFGLCDLFLRIGKIPRFYIWNPPKKKKIGERTVSQSTLYYVKCAVSNPLEFLHSVDYEERTRPEKHCIERDNYFLVPIKQIKKLGYKGDVYNLEVKKDHSYLANFAGVANCQNYSISQDFTETMIDDLEETTPRKIVEETLLSGAEGIAYTYTEPTVFAEYALETMKLARKKGLYNAWVSNGYMSREVIDAIAPFLDAINIDLKGNARFYREVCGNADLEKVKLNIRYFAEKKIHIELTYLIIPGFNDNKKDLEEAVGFVASVDSGMPLHFSRFFPMYKMLNTQQTPIATLEKAKSVAEKAGLEYVYLGNLGAEENTLCPKCNSILIRRHYYTVSLEGIGKKAECKKCGYKTGIIL